MEKYGVALALSSGGARGLAHIGVLKVLERHRIPIVAIAGSSMGGVIGALYSTGYSGEMIHDIARRIKRSHWMDFSLSKMGILAGKKLEALIELYTQGKTFADCKPPLQLVAADIELGAEVVLNTGSLARAVRATSSIPGVFSPVVIDNRTLVDGGIVNRVPVSVLPQVPHNVTVAVDVGVTLTPRVHSLFDVLFQSFDIMARELSRYQPVEADVVIKPKVDFSRESHAYHVDAIVQAGEDACEAAISHIIELLGER
ncbi:MAG: patatin [Sulfobacillus thermosulfidooxidans]|uniref:Patatin n=1 Tax=Sulfobacillus thermotolerans TaxID=338644 RepID=A0ABM6RSW7_9FIRM|nr:patatin-like phospholipase family protein [Sulfobacillus sp. hq2]AUW94517.1 patatin [Sulfobacillus thermotolerans]MCY0908049.1 patatin-like phospholipase family protein [Sulfobacillus thermotolerans]POB09189.1 patatin [Sulfobacillus sp. hq2]PSR36911.1 MAG: patatin [Sulfobacillus thermosulfidooxidans]